MMVVALVLVSLVTGVSALGDSSKLGRIGGKAIALYLFTTAVAITIALSLGYALIPEMQNSISAGQEFVAKQAPSFKDILTGLIPDNPIKAMAAGNMLQIIVFAIFIGLGILKAGDKARNLNQLFLSANEVILNIVMLVMRIAPLGVFCLISKTFASEGLDLIVKLGEHFFTVLLALLCHAVITYTCLLYTSPSPRDQRGSRMPSSA